MGDLCPVIQSYKSPVRFWSAFIPKVVISWIGVESGKRGRKREARIEGLHWFGKQFVSGNNPMSFSKWACAIKNCRQKNCIYNIG